MEHRFSPRKYYYCFGPNEPALRLKAGDKIVSETVDARGCDSEGNPIPETKKQRSEYTEYFPANPLVGPFYIEDAELDDTLVVKIKKSKYANPMITLAS